jgi:predicted extracellular nuclease
MKLLNYLLVFFFLTCISCSTPKKQKSTEYDIERSRNSFRIMFYNVENLFHPDNDPKKRDDEFTPDGTRNWSFYRYKDKIQNIYKVIVAVGGWDLPDIIGFCEIENRQALEDLLQKTPLQNTDYQIIHHESPDNRGIDVALFYRKTKFTPIIDFPIRINFPAELSTRPTRDILYVKGLTNRADTLHIFINHWPSRYGGQMETEALRNFCGNLVKSKVDSLLKIDNRANIIITGDFNDYPKDKSISNSLGAQSDFSKIKANELYNLSYHLMEEKNLGTLRFQGQWGVLDQFILSGTLLDTLNNSFTSKEHVHIFSVDWLLEKDERYGGYQPYRTYRGFKFNGGYSDHLPTYLDLHFKN